VIVDLISRPVATAALLLSVTIHSSLAQPTSDFPSAPAVGTHSPALLNPEIFSGDSYPDFAKRTSEGGRVELYIKLNSEGRVTWCRLARSTGWLDLDVYTCRLFQQRARFAPEAGRLDQWLLKSINWQLDDVDAGRVFKVPSGKTFTVPHENGANSGPGSTESATPEQQAAFERALQDEAVVIVTWIKIGSDRRPISCEVRRPGANTAMNASACKLLMKNLVVPESFETRFNSRFAGMDEATFVRETGLPWRVTRTDYERWSAASSTPR